MYTELESERANTANAEERLSRIVDAEGRILSSN